MARIISAYAVPHTPSFIAEARGNAPYTGGPELFKKIAAVFDQNRPDVLVMVQNDHFNTFFLNNWPTYAIGTAEETGGPSDQTPDMPRYRVKVRQDLATVLQKACIEADFDISTSQELTVDHSVLVPLHFLTPAMDIPIVPIFINCLVPPLPRARRCYELGRIIRSALEAAPQNLSIGLLASGSLSLEVGGPKMEPGKTFGVPDRSWAQWILERIRSGHHEELIDAATETRMFAAGNVGGELLNWITLLGMIGEQAPSMVLDQPALGNAFAAWQFERAS